MSIRKSVRPADQRAMGNEDPSTLTLRISRKPCQGSRVFRKRRGVGRKTAGLAGIGLWNDIPVNGGRLQPLSEIVPINGTGPFMPKILIILGPQESTLGTVSTGRLRR